MQQWALLHSAASACSQSPSVGIVTLRQSMLRHLQTVYVDSDIESDMRICPGRPQRKVIQRLLSTLQLMEGPSLSAALCAPHISCTAADLPATCLGT